MIKREVDILTKAKLAETQKKARTRLRQDMKVVFEDSSSHASSQQDQLPDAMEQNGFQAQIATLTQEVISEHIQPIDSQKNRFIV